VPDVTIPQVPGTFADNERIEALVEELRISNAEYLVTLGDDPLREFVSKFDNRFTRLVALGQTPEAYGREYAITIGGKSVKLIPLVHPRQAGRLGSSSKGWGELHDAWVAQRLGTGEASC
jgi:uracil-DNA glycosylase